MPQFVHEFYLPTNLSTNTPFRRNLVEQKSKTSQCTDDHEDKQYTVLVSLQYAASRAAEGAYHPSNI